MNYYIDTEFLEGTQKKWFGQTKPTIDLISIGIVAEDGREYYAISKEFSLKEAWNRWQQRTGEGDRNNTEPKLYWIRENVLKPICVELEIQYLKDHNPVLWLMNQDKDWEVSYIDKHFSYKRLKYLINKYGKTNKQIASDIRSFTGCITPEDMKYVGNRDNERIFTHFLLETNKEVEWQMDLSIPDKDVKKTIQEHYNSCAAPDCKFYGYYSDYDWVVFCWLFGKMIDWPKGFPMYCIDLKQELDAKVEFLQLFYHGGLIPSEKDRLCNNEEKLEKIKNNPNYPKQTNEHNALSDARWNQQLYTFLNTL